jgi:hypothetical protein
MRARGRPPEPASELARGAGQYQPLVFGIGVILTVMFFRDGIARRLFPRVEGL